MGEREFQSDYEQPLLLRRSTKAQATSITLSMEPTAERVAAAMVGMVATAAAREIIA
jgi:hypothetical protein